MKIKQWLKDHKPVFQKEVSRIELARSLAVSAERGLEKSFDQRVAEAEKEANALVSKFYEIEIRPLDRNEYTVCCNFNTNMMAHANHDPKFLEYIADRVGYEIRQHIVSAKFLHNHSERVGRRAYEQRPPRLS